MKRWTNGLPGATQRLGAMMAQRGLSASQPWMRADPHRGPERNRSTLEAEYIDAAPTFALSDLHLAPHGRAIHPHGRAIHMAQMRSPGVSAFAPVVGVERTSVGGAERSRNLSRVGMLPGFIVSWLSATMGSGCMAPGPNTPSSNRKLSTQFGHGPKRRHRHHLRDLDRATGAPPVAGAGSMQDGPPAIFKAGRSAGSSPCAHMAAAPPARSAEPSNATLIDPKSVMPDHPLQ